MKTLATFLSASLCLTAAASAESEIHSANYTYSMAVNGDNYPRLRFPGFDDMNGERVLTRVDVRVQSEIAATLAIENMTEAPLGDWSLDGQHLVLTGFEREDPKSFGPFAFMGGLFIEPITGTLQPSDGTPRAGADYLATSLSTTIDSIIDMDPSYLDFFGGGGEVVAVAGPFTEFFLDGATMYDPKLGVGDATVEFTALAQTGTLSVIYEFTTVPEPTGGAALAAVSMLLAGRRCRRRW